MGDGFILAYRDCVVGMVLDCGHRRNRNAIFMTSPIMAKIKLLRGCLIQAVVGDL